ncbi:MAG: IPT/TIG domain-containing protein, partial [Candidatus Nomurabacteria bacterium]|nr:IPT/TIG domain-containing protein [Candidatus Nomurabacteria bacterium]
MKLREFRAPNKTVSYCKSFAISPILSLSLSLGAAVLVVSLAWLTAGGEIRADGPAVSVSAISPNRGPTAGGETVTITGTGFDLLDAGTPTDFAYQGSPDTYNVPADGIYKLEVWGAAAGGGSTGYGCNFQNTGKGGYSVGTIYLYDDDTVSVYVG